MGPDPQAPDRTGSITRRGHPIVWGAMGIAIVLALLYVGLPAVAGLDNTWRRLAAGDPAWLAVAAALEVLSFASYMAFFRTVLGRDAGVGWSASYRITMAGVAATRLLAVAGAGGIALTAWALRRRGLARRQVAAGMATFYVVLYGLYMAALAVFGFGLRSGALAGPAPFWLTVAPAVLGATAIAVALAVAAVSDDLDDVLSRLANRPGAHRALAAIPATLAVGVRGALDLLRRRQPGLLGAVGWWTFDIGVLAACLHAFGASASFAVIVMAYFVGMLANTIPIPGGVGAVDGGMIAALIGFGVEGGPAIVAVLSYRALSFWLPVIPGAIAYVQLLREPSAVAVGSR